MPSEYPDPTQERLRAWEALGTGRRPGCGSHTPGGRAQHPPCPAPAAVTLVPPRRNTSSREKPFLASSLSSSSSSSGSPVTSLGRQCRLAWNSKGCWSADIAGGTRARGPQLASSFRRRTSVQGACPEIPSLPAPSRAEPGPDVIGNECFGETWSGPCR